MEFPALKIRWEFQEIDGRIGRFIFGNFRLQIVETLNY